MRQINELVRILIALCLAGCVSIFAPLSLAQGGESALPGGTAGKIEALGEGRAQKAHEGELVKGE